MKLREALQKALVIFDWLERRTIYQDAQVKDAHDAVRAALAEPVADAPVARVYYDCGECPYPTSGCPDRCAKSTRPAAAPAERGESATIMALVEDYAKAVHEGDDNACTVLQRTIQASIEQLCVDADRAQRVPAHIRVMAASVLNALGEPFPREEIDLDAVRALAQWIGAKP